MFSKLRERTGKQFVKKYQFGGPVEPGQSIGETKQGSDGNMYKWTGVQWTLDHFSLPARQISTPEGFSHDPSLPPGTYRSQVPGMEGMILGTPTLGTTNLGTSNDDEDSSLLDLAVSATDAWTRREDESAGDFRSRRSEYSRQDLRQLKKDLRQAKRDGDKGAGDALKELKRAQFNSGFGGSADGTLASAIGNFSDGNWKTGVTDLAVAGIKAVDDLAMGDKNFGTQSAAIDTAVHGTAGALMKSGNPYAMIAGAALEGVNFLSKAGGQTVQGFDVDLNSSGYGDLGHMESSSSRAIPFLGGWADANRIQNKLAKRNQQAQMAMLAANVANEQRFEQEARMSSAQNTIMNNQIALAGGLDTSLLGG